MADPLSVTLAVVTFATAVKDMVELGQKIHESFAKVSKNLRNAQRVAKEIKEMAEEIEVFYEANKDVLDSMKDFGMALEGLLDKFRSFDRTILPLLPQTDRRGPGVFLRGWWNNNKIEGRILDLESDIVKVMRRYMMSGVMRNEVKLERIHQDANKRFTDVQTSITQGLEALEVVRRNVSVIATTMPSRSYESAGTSSDEFDRNVIMFAQSTASTSVPMLRTPNVITEELMTAAYIKLQINSIAMTVEKMSTLPVSALDLNNIDPFKLTPLQEDRLMGIMHLRHHVVRQVTDIRDLLDTNHVPAISMHEGSIDLDWLSTSLDTLGMSHESILVGKWAITLAQTVVDASGGGPGQPHLDASLALVLLNQAMKYRRSGDDLQSVQAVKEAHTITRTLLDHYGGEIHFQILHSSVVLEYAYFVDNQRSIEMILQAIQLLERILNVQAFSHSGSHKQFEPKVVQPDLSFFDNLFSSAPPMSAIIEYTLALRRLGNYLFIDGRPEAALDLARLSIVLLRKIVSTHGHMYRVNLADALSLVVESETASCIPAEELVNMADECIQISRELTEKNPLYYARQLVNVLWVKADTLDSLGQDAISTWEEVASLAGQIIQDSELCAAALVNLTYQFRRLKRHSDAVQAARLAISTYHEKVETRAARYFSLSLDLRELRHYKESMEAARTSVTLYRHLAMRDPATWMGNLTRGLADLAHCLAASGDYSAAMLAWKESLSILDSFLNTDPEATLDAINGYLAALQGYICISHALEDEEKCLEVSFSAVRYLHQLSKICPQNADIMQHLMQAEFWYAYNMLRVGRPHDAQQYVDQWIDRWSGKPEAMSKSSIQIWHARMMNLKADILDAQGCTEQALLVTQKVHDIVRPFITTSGRFFYEMIESMVREAQLRANLGESEDAMQAAEGALQLARDNKLEPIINSLVCSLYGIALTMLSCQNYDRAVETARGGCDLLASPDGMKIWQDSEYHSFLCPSLFAILSSAEGNLGRYSTALEYAHRAVDASLEIREMKAWVSATTAEHSYMKARGNLAEILLATGELAQARQICEERSTYFSKRVQKRMGDYRELAPILRMLGVLSCSEGRHEEGATAAQELSRIIKTLGSAFPSLQEQVKIRLRRQAKVPILKVLEDMTQVLDCGHQSEIASLFAV